MLVSGVQQSDLVFFFFQIIFHYGLLQNIKQSSLCYKVNLCSLSILCIVICAAMHIGVHVSFQIKIFCLLWIHAREQDCWII